MSTHKMSGHDFFTTSGVGVCKVHVSFCCRTAVSEESRDFDITDQGGMPHRRQDPESLSLQNTETECGAAPEDKG